MSTTARGNWNNRLGFILAASGSAIGLGNVWRFPYTAGESGGGAFVLIYLLFVVLIGMPVLFSELSLGRHTEKNPVGAFKKIVPKGMWPWVGGLGVATGFGILAFYSVVAGWTLAYLISALSGDFGGVITAEHSAEIFTDVISDPGYAILLAGVFILLTILVVRGGISDGIERATTIMMPLLFILLIVLAIRAVTLPGATEGLTYLFYPDFSKISVGVVMSALGQALFSLSLGMGAMITYGSYLSKSENLFSAGASVAFFDTLIAILSGVIIFPALFAAGGDPAGGPGLVFVVLPTIFNALPAGWLFAIAFYALLAIAALTSTISLLEVVVSYFVDERQWTRNKAAWLLGGVCFVIAIPSALSQGAVSWLSSDGFFGWDFLTLQNNLWGNYSLSIGAFLISVFVGWKWGIPRALASIEASGDTMPLSGLWAFLVRYICPAAILAVMIYIVWTGSYF